MLSMPLKQIIFVTKYISASRGLRSRPGSLVFYFACLSLHWFIVLSVLWRINVSNSVHRPRSFCKRRSAISEVKLCHTWNNRFVSLQNATYNKEAQARIAWAACLKWSCSGKFYNNYFYWEDNRSLLFHVTWCDDRKPLVKTFSVPWLPSAHNPLLESRKRKLFTIAESAREGEYTADEVWYWNVVIPTVAFYSPLSIYQFRLESTFFTISDLLVQVHYIICISSCSLTFYARGLAINWTLEDIQGHTFWDHWKVKSRRGTAYICGL